MQKESWAGPGPVDRPDSKHREERDPMKVVAFNGSPRKDGNTAILLNFVLEELKNEGIDVKLVQLAGERITGCIACHQCAKNKDQKCVIKDDKANDYIAKMVQAEGFLLGSPLTFLISRPT